MCTSRRLGSDCAARTNAGALASGKVLANALVLWRLPVVVVVPCADWPTVRHDRRPAPGKPQPIHEAIAVAALSRTASALHYVMFLFNPPSLPRSYLFLSRQRFLFVQKTVTSRSRRLPSNRRRLPPTAVGYSSTTVGYPHTAVGCPSSAVPPCTETMSWLLDGPSCFNFFFNSETPCSESRSHWFPV